jgi:anti-sigma factor RsiW
MNLTRHNYEEYFLRYVDGELAADERLEVEAFLEEHPDLFEEMDSLHMTVLPQDEVFAFDKNLLYRYTPEERPARVVPFTRWRLSAAAAVVIALGTSAALWIARDRRLLHTDSPSIAMVRPGKGTPAGNTGTPNSTAATGATAGASSAATTAPATTAPATTGATPSVTAPTGATPGGSPADVASTTAPTSVTPSSIAKIEEVSRGHSVIGSPSETPHGDTHPDLQTASSGDLASAHPAIGANPVLHDPTAPQHPQVTPLAATQTNTDALASKENNPVTPVTSAPPVSYHTLEDGDKEADGDKILFVRADQVVNGEVKGFFRRAGRLLKRSTSLTNDNVRPDSDR